MLWSKNVGEKCSGAVSIGHYCSKSYEIKDKKLLKQSGNHLTLIFMHSMCIRKIMLVSDLLIITDETTFISS